MAVDLRGKDISVEQVKQLSEKTPSMLWLTLLTAGFIALILSGNVAIWIPAALFLSMVFLIILRFWHYMVLRRKGVNHDNANIHLACFVCFAFAGGAIWGILGLVIPISSDMFLLVLIATLLCGLVASAVSYLSIYKMAFFSFAIVSICPFAIRCILTQQEIFVAIGTLMVLFLLVNLFNSHLTQINIIKGIKLEQKNRDLIKRLTYEKNCADDARKIADHNNAAKSRYLATASHDLRQPLNAMGFFVEALQYEKDPVKIQQLIKRVSQSSEALGNLIGSLLDISRIEAGVMEPRQGHFILNDLFADIVQQFTDQACDKGLSFDVKPCLQTVYSDKGMLGRILRNLVSNAIHYTEHGFINISGTIESGLVVINISDSGTGIAEENIDKVFHEFFRISKGAYEPSQGLGLGLSIVDGLCRLLGHEIKIHSEPGIGSVFSVKVSQGNLNMVTTTSEPMNISGGVMAKVMILSDGSESVDNVSEAMRRWGYSVADFTDSREGLVFLESEDFIPDLIIMDNDLHSESVIEVIIDLQRKISLKSGHKIPAIILTGAGGEVQEKIQSYGFSLLQKPVQPAKLRSMASYLVRGERQAGAVRS